MSIKISKIHQRLQKSNPSQNNPARVRTYPKTDNAVPQGMHVIWMSQEKALSFDTTNYCVISIGDKDRTESHYPQFKEAIDVLYLNFNPEHDAHESINEQHSCELTLFVSKHKDKNFIVHCYHGQLRSKGVAIGLRDAINDYYGKEQQCSLYNAITISTGSKIVRADDEMLYMTGFDGKAQYVTYKATMSALKVE